MKPLSKPLLFDKRRWRELARRIAAPGSSRRIDRLISDGESLTGRSSPATRRRVARVGSIVFELVRIASLAATLEEGDETGRDELALQLEALAGRVRL